jgi:hypothetical protein
MTARTFKKILAAVLVALLALAIFFACVDATSVARWCFALFILTAAGTIIAAIFRDIDKGELDTPEE